MKRKTIPFLNINCSIPVISLVLDDGTKCIALVDTGADATVIDAKFVKENRANFTVHKTEKKALYTGVNSSSIYPVILAKAPFYSANGQILNLSAELMDLDIPMSSFQDNYGVKPSILIGSELLNSLNAKIDYEKKELVFNDIPSK